MIRGRHYNSNPVAPDGSPLPTPPEWIIISADPSIARFLPVRCEEAQGIIVARGQVAIQDGTLVPRLENSPITLTIDEFHRGVLDFNLFVNPFNSCEKPNATPSEKPYRLFWNDDLIKNIRIFAQTTINRLFIQNKVNINANNTCNIYHVHNNFDFSNHLHNTWLKYLNLNVSNIHKEEEIFVNQDMRTVNVNQNTTNGNINNIKNNELIYHPKIQESIIEPKFETKTLNPVVESLTVDPTFNAKTSQPVIDSLKVEPINRPLLAEPTIEELKIKPNVNTIISEPIISSNEIRPKLNQVISTPTVNEHLVEPIMKTTTSNPIVENHNVIPENRTITSTPIVLNHDLQIQNDTIISKAIVENLKILIEKKISNVSSEIPDVKLNIVKVNRLFGGLIGTTFKKEKIVWNNRKKCVLLVYC